MKIFKSGSNIYQAQLLNKVLMLLAWQNLCQSIHWHSGCRDSINLQSLFL